MNQTNSILLRMPGELKHRLQKQAKSQGVTVDQFALYVLNHQLTYLERHELLEKRLARRKIATVRRQAKNVLSKVSTRAVPEWDRM